LRIKSIDIESIKTIKFQWGSFLEKSNFLPVYQTPTWIYTWLKFLGHRHKLFILTLWNGNELVALYPLGLKRTLFVKKLEFIGRDDGDYLDFIVDNSHKEKCIESFLSFLRKKKKEWNLCDLKDFAGESQNYKFLYELLKKEGWKVVLHDTWSCPYLEIDGDWNGFLKRHGRKFQYNIKRERRQLENLGNLEFKKIQSQEELEHYLPQVFEVHKRRWKGYYISSKFSTPQGQKFYTEIAKNYLSKGMLRLDLLLLDEKVIAFSYSFQWNGRYFYYTPGYDPDYARYSPGTVLLIYILEDAFKSGLKEFDFSKGELQYKSHWATGERQNRRIIFASPTLKGRIAFHLYLLHLNLFSHVRKLKSLRIILGRLRQLQDFINRRRFYVPPEAVASPREIFKTNSSKDKPLNGYLSDALFFKDGRTALFCGLKTCGISQGSTLLIPAYICDSVISAVRSAGLRYRFYRILSNLEPDFKDLELKSEGAEALLIIHYFGFPQPLERIMGFCQSKGVLLIEDCAHALYSKLEDKPLGSFGLFGVFSLKKTLPLPDGGMLLLNHGRTAEAKEIKGGYPVLSTLSQLEKWTEFKTGISPRCYLLQIDSLRNGFIKRDNGRKIVPGKGISTTSLRLFHEVNADEIIDKRRNNYQYYLKRLVNRKGLQILYPELSDGVCPIGFPILIENRDGIRKRLLKKGVNLRTFWDIMPAEIPHSEHPIAYEISKKILILPVHQSVEKKYLDYVVKQLAILQEFDTVTYVL
jgi:CelD/BcsL family acetyltransferase involved in cellulose biosynthesis/dTDP-4-amino-4,6-dideoxygalactose transaminase